MKRPTMTYAERILKTFRGERPDVMPWFADLTYWYRASLTRGTLPRKYEGDRVVDLYRDLGCGCHEHALNRPWVEEYEDVTIAKTVEEDSAGQPALEKTEWVTPVGTLTQVKEWEPISFSWAYRKYPVGGVEDLRTLRFIHGHLHVRPDYSSQEHQLRLWGGVGVPSSVPPRSPMANLIVIWMGVLNLCYALADQPGEVDETLEVLGAAQDDIYDIITRSPAPLVYFGDNITGDVVSPTIFRKYYAPYYHRRVPGLHAAGKRIFVHVDGTFRTVLPLMAETGVDCAQSLTVAPLGDVAIHEMRALAGPDLVLWSGVPGALFSPQYPVQMVVDTVLECIEHHKAPGRFIMGVCDQVPPDGDIERVRLVSELVERYGRYDE
ncbi:MAG: hypothetical protein HYY04_03900 [Chloroflexi bacterium]|nr:hypothetical protein [Chloroflexota bacterium]